MNGSALMSRAVDVGFLLAMMLLASVPLWPIYQHPHLFVTIGGGLLLGGLLAVAGARWRWPVYMLAAATAVGYLVVGVPLAVPGGTLFGFLPRIDGLSDLVLGTGLSWKQMLSVSLPLGDYEGLLIPVLVVVLVTSVAAFSVVLRTRRPAWGMVAPILVFAFGILFGPPEPFVPLVSGTALAAAGLLWTIRGFGPVAARRLDADARRARQTDRLRRAIAGVVLSAVCLAGGGWLGGVVAPAQARLVARDAVKPPFDPHDYVSPLVGFRNSVLPPKDTATMLTVDGLPSGGRIRLAALDDYDGLVFAVGANPAANASGSFERVPLRVQRDADEQRGKEVTLRFTVDELGGVWLPTAGALESIDFAGAGAARADDFFYNRVASSAALLGGVDRGLAYTVHTRVASDLSDARLAALRPATAKQSGADAIPEAIVDAVGEHGGSGSTGKRLVALATWLRSGYVSDSRDGEPFSRPGHSADRLSALVAETPILGDAEQYAPALALMARELGFPSRVVLGYAPKSEDGEKVTVTGADLTAWVEVQDTTGAWFTVDPNPPVREVPKQKKTSSEIIAHPRPVPPPPPPSKQDTESSAAADDTKPPEPEQVPGWLVVLQTVLGVASIVLPVLSIVLAPLWATALIRYVRRRRRRKQDRENRVVTGAWNEITDAIADLGHTVPPSATRRDIAALVGAQSVRVLAERADRTVFDTIDVSDDEIGSYWVDVRSAHSELASELSRWQRLRVAISWVSILNRARSWYRQRNTE